MGPRKEKQYAPISGSTGCICTTCEKDFSRKWKAVVKRDMAHIPEVDRIIEFATSRTYGEAKQLMSALGDVLLLTYARQQSRMFFPTNVLTVALWPNLLMADLIKGANQETSELIETFNFSGQGGFAAYAGSHTQEAAAQVFFHSLMGTFKEDFGILSKITTIGRWFTRSELGTGFTKRAPGGNTHFTVPRMLYWSKLSRSNLSGMLTNTYSQISSVAVFSGKREVTFKKDFIDYLSSQNSDQVAAPRTMVGMVEMFVHLKRKITNELQKNNCKHEYGTTTWYSMEGLTEGEKVEANFVVRTTGRFFLGRND